MNRLFTELLDIDIISSLEDAGNNIQQFNECETMKNNEESMICLRYEGDDLYGLKYTAIERGKSIGVDARFTVKIGDELLVSVSMVFGLFDNLNAMSVGYNINGPYNDQILFFEHIDDSVVTANSAIQRIYDVINGGGILTDNLSFIQFYKGQSNLGLNSNVGRKRNIQARIDKDEL